MCQWDIKVQRSSIELVVHNDLGTETNETSSFLANTLEEVVGWVAGEMSPGDWATVNGSVVMQRFSRRPPAII